MLIGRANYKYTDWLEYGQEVDEGEPLIGWVRDSNSALCRLHNTNPILELHWMRNTDVAELYIEAASGVVPL